MSRITIMFVAPMSSDHEDLGAMKFIIIIINNNIIIIQFSVWYAVWRHCDPAQLSLLYS